MYQIFVDRFYNGDISNDVVDGEYCYVDKLPVEQVKNWNTVPAHLDVGCFYGGDLEGVRQKLDYLSSVSYTHLDVYKRQELARQKFGLVKPDEVLIKGKENQ